MTLTTSNRALCTLAAALMASLVTLAGCETSDGQSGDANTKKKATSKPSEPDPDPTVTAAAGESLGSDTPRSEETVSQGVVESLTAGNAHFGIDVYQQWVDANEGNLFFSPHSLSTVMAMVYAGAQKETATQMREALSFRPDDSELHRAFNHLNRTLTDEGTDKEKTQDGENSGDPFQLNLAQGLWVQPDFPVKQAYLETLASQYGAAMQTAPFASDAEQARQTINQWVAEKTADKIKDLLPEGSVQSNTRLMLTDTIYFKAGWKMPFQSSQTSEGTFTNLDGSTSQTPMMSQRARSGMRHAKTGSWQAVEMPYVGGSTSMLLIVPDAGTFDSVESNLSTAFLRKVVDRLDGKAVHLTMPKFEMSSGFSAKKMLSELGMASAFNPDEANFSAMSPADKLFIQDVQHKAYITVDEEGTEAAAASAAGMGITSMPQYTKVTVDRPFIFAIRHRETGAILFMGRVASL
jgi:serpin B